MKIKTEKQQINDKLVELRSLISENNKKIYTLRSKWESRKEWGVLSFIFKSATKLHEELEYHRKVYNELKDYELIISNMFYNTNENSK